MKNKNSTSTHQDTSNIKIQGPEIYFKEVNGLTLFTFGCVSEKANEGQENLNDILQLGDNLYPCDKETADKQISSQFIDFYPSSRTMPGK